MSSHEHSSTSQPAHQGDASEVSADTLARCAELLASGEMDWPAGLTIAQESVLLAKARQCRRARLVRFIASTIAADIARAKRGGT